MKRLLSSLLLSFLFVPAFVRGQDHARFTRTEDVVYGRKFGTALTLDVITPDHANGYGIIAVISGGFFSSHDAINPGFFSALLERGYTVFAVVHGSQPRFIIPEIEQDIHRAARFIRHNASTYSIHPGHLGIFGASAGGHLSLTMGTQGHPGDPNAKDPVERESSEVQAVACFFPPTDFLNWGKDGEDAVGVGPLVQFQPAFGPASSDAESRQAFGRKISPIYYVSPRTAPTLIIHGDADGLVPLQQAQRFVRRCEEAGVKVKLEVRPGKNHGWPGMEKDLKEFADWYDIYLRGKKPSE